MFKTLFFKLKYHSSLVEIIEEYGATALNTLGVAAVVSIAARFYGMEILATCPTRFEFIVVLFLY